MLARPDHRGVLRGRRPVPPQRVASRRARRRRGAPGRGARSRCDGWSASCRRSPRPWRRATAALLVGATDWCTHPADLDVTRVRGTKNPDVGRDRRAGARTWSSPTRRRTAARTSTPSAPRACRCTSPTSAPSTACGASARWPACSRPAGSPVRRGSTTPSARGPPCPSPPRRRRAVVPIWRRPVDGRGARHVHRRSAGPARRRQRLVRRSRTLSALRPGGAACRHDLVVLPDEPYNFTAEDGPEAFPGTQSALVSGRLLTWYGPSLAEAARVLPALLQED